MQFHKDQSDQKLDSLVDATLRTYGRGEPRTGLEQRILARLRSEPAPRPVWNWRWAMAGAAALAGVAVLAFVLRPGTKPQSVQTNTDDRAIAGQPVAPPLAAKPAEAAAVARHAPRREHQPAEEPVFVAQASPPRLPQFPTPTVQTQQEQLLAQVAAQADPQKLVALAKANDDGIQPMEIKPIETSMVDSAASSAQNPGLDPGH